MEITTESVIALVTVWGVRVLGAILVLIAGWMIGNWLARRVQAVKTMDQTLCVFLSGLAKYAVFAVAIVTVLAQFGIQTASLIAVLGAAGLAIGLALQGTLSNVAAGMMLLILRPFNVGDYITFGGIGGTVKSLGLFGTELATPDNVYIFAPNSSIWNSDIYNYSRNGERRQDFVVSISYSDDIDKAMKVLDGVIDKETRLIREEGRMPQIMVSNMGDFSVDLILRVWSPSSDYWQLQWDMKKAIKEALDKNGLTIPFPTRTLHMVEEAKSTKSSGTKKAA
ncbi:MAG: mechanosensitive ion channel [Alphaproteobacteria bacterium]|nr:mechanosensitive ion channel [Alphaproteobacteria bacterium]